MKHYQILYFGLLLFLYHNTYSQRLIVEDAERFAAIFKSNPDSISTSQLQTEYLDPGTKGIKIFTPKRIRSAENLSKWVNARRKSYEKAVKTALPAAISLSDEIEPVFQEIQQLLKQKKGADVYVVFGALNSGGTASSKGLVIGLEVIARFAQTEEEAREVIRSFIAHELVHVYQSRVAPFSGLKKKLLAQAIREGFCDFVENRVLNGISASEKERHTYGLAHEAQLWQEFKQVMDGKVYAPWMFARSTDERPADLGYWIGKRICEAYYEKSPDKEAAIQELLKMKNPERILEKSGYNPQ